MAETTPEKLAELPPATREWLADLRPDELETMKAVVEQPADDVRNMFKIVRNIQTVGWFLKWLIITFVAIFIGTVSLYENVLKVIGYLKGSSQ